MTDDPHTRLLPSTQNWLILTIGFVVLFVSGGSRFALGLLLKPMAVELDWGRALVSFIGMVFLTLSALGQPAVGRLVDRYNPLWIVGVGLLLSGMGLALTGAVTALWQALLVYGVIYAMGQTATSLTPIGVMVMRVYAARRGLATSVAISGMATGQLVMMGLLTSVLVYLGWRGSFVLLGVVNALLLIALGIIARRLPHRSHAAPAPTAPAAPATQNDGTGLFSRPAMRLLLIVYMICGFQDFFVSTHVVAFATDHGVSAFVAGNVFALMGLMGLIGVVVTGALSDTFGPVLPTALCFLTRMMLFGYIPFMHDDISIMLFALLYGATFLMTAPLTIVFAEQTVGRTHMGWVTGILNMVHHTAGGLGAFLGGSVFDRWGSYNPALGLMLVLSIVAIWATWRVKSRLAPSSNPTTC